MPQARAAGPPEPSTQHPAPIRLAAAIVAGALIWFWPRPEGVDAQGWHLLAVFAATILGMILQAMELGAVVLLGLVAALLTGSMSLGAAMGGFANGSVWLIVSAFLFSHAVASTGLGQRIAFLFIRAFGRRTLGLGYALAASEAVIAPAVPANTARAGGIMYPVVAGIARACGSLPDRSPRRMGAFLMLCQFHVTIVLSAMFLTSMAANPLIAELALKTSGVQLTWTLWARAALVPGLVSLALIPWALYRLCPPEAAESPEAPAEARKRLDEMGSMKPAEIRLAAIVAGCLVLWATTPLHRLDPTTVAFVGLTAMLASRVIAWKDVTGTSGAWDALLWFGGLVGMADALARAGVTAWFARAIAAHIHGPWFWTLPVLALIYFYSHYAFASMTAHATAMYAAFLGVAVAAGAPPVMAALVLAVFSSLNGALTHYSTGPAVIFFESGYVGQSEWWRLGFVVSVIHLVVWGGLALPYWKAIGIW